MRRRIVVFCLVLTALTACAARVPPLPLTESVHCTATAVAGGSEYRLSVEKDSDEIATYRFLAPEAIEGLTYAFVGSECTVSYCGMAYAACGSVTGVVDRLHEALTFDRSVLLRETDGFTADAKSGRFLILTLSDGNVSEIASEDDQIHVFFHFAP